MIKSHSRELADVNQELVEKYTKFSIRDYVSPDFLETPDYKLLNEILTEVALAMDQDSNQVEHALALIVAVLNTYDASAETILRLINSQELVSSSSNSLNTLYVAAHVAALSRFNTNR